MMRSEMTYTGEEVDAIYKGRAVLVDYELSAIGHWTAYYPQTLLSPEEPSMFSTEGDTIEVLRVTDNGDDLALTPEVVAVATAAAWRDVAQRRDDIHTGWLEDALARAEATRENDYNDDDRHGDWR